MKKIYPIIQYVNEHFSEKISLEDICGLIPMDKYYFCKLFKKSTGITFTQYLTQIRIEHAEHLLTTTDKTVADIAFACGFSTVQYFITVFVKAKGCTPHAFRRIQF